MISDEEQKKLAINCLTAIGMNSIVAKTPEQLLYERIELLEIKAENIEIKFKNLERLVTTLDKSSEM